MRYLWLAVFFVAFMSAPAIVRAEQCRTTSVEQLIRNASAQKPTIFEATPLGLEKLLTFMNKNRAKTGKEPVDADLVLIAVFKDGRVGIALAKDGCALPNMVFSIDAPMLSRIMNGAGIDGADIVPSKQGAGA
jgi:hypothetical protein